MSLPLLTFMALKRRLSTVATTRLAMNAYSAAYPANAPTAHHRAVKARCPLRSRIRAEWQSVRACAAVARCDILLTADAVQSAGGAFTFPDRLAVGRLTLDQLTVVRIHVREPDSLPCASLRSPLSLTERASMHLVAARRTAPSSTGPRLRRSQPRVVCGNDRLRPACHLQRADGVGDMIAHGKGSAST